MGSGQTPLTGPDLAQGISTGELADGQPVLGHAAGEPVLLVRRGQEVLAVGATCTHYGGPLAEGLVVEGTVRCPWHHACFDLRTGEATRGPALNPIPCYRVEHAGDRVRVAERLVPAPRPRRPPPPASVLIVGAGAAGAAAAEALRREGYGGTITMIGREDSVPYDRPNLSKDYLAGTAPEEWIPLRGEDFYREQGIDLVRGVAATALDAGARAVTLADGRTLRADRVLLATGADPVRLGIPGADLPHVHVLRSLEHSRRIIAALGAGTRAVVVGASFIGMEVAAALRARGVEVHVVAPDACPFERVLGASVGDYFKNVHLERGVQFHLGETLTRIDAGAVTLVGGKVLAADLVIAGIGVRPALELPATAGLRIDRGVAVDAYLETSAPGVFAAGDLARWPDPHTGAPIRVEHWVVAQRMGQTAARNMLGAREPFAAVPFFWTAQYDLTLSYLGHAERWDRIDVDGSLEARDCTIAYRAGGRTLAIATVGRDQVRLRAEAALEAGDRAALEALLPPAR